MSNLTKSLLAAALALALGACASQPPAKTVAEPVVKRNCVRETGTRIETPEGKCAIASGRAYTAEDLERSGAQSVGEAVRRMVR